MLWVLFSTVHAQYFYKALTFLGGSLLPLAVRFCDDTFLLACFLACISSSSSSSCQCFGLDFLKNWTIRMFTGRAISEPKIDVKMEFKLRMMKPMWILVSALPSSSRCSSLVLKNIALASMVVNSKDRQQVSRCTRVKLLLVGRENSETQRWSSVRFLRAFAKKRWLKPCISSVPATGSIRSTWPSSSSAASHREHRKKWL